MTDKPIPEGKQVYEGSCQCGAVAYTVVLNPIENASVTTCGCSICTRNGYALVYPRRDRVTWLRGYDTLKSFRFGPKRVDHKFCPECGSSVLHDPHLPDYQQFLPPGAPDVFGLNVRMFKGIDMSKLTLRLSNPEDWVFWKAGEEYDC